ncbi:MAG TPA: PilX N-terminal domain-containing pilus assembly protein [Burkholderiaceae bacterium]
MSAPSSSLRSGRRSERGFVLVTGLLFLVVLTLLCLALFRSSGVMDRISANTRDKQRSFEAAQAAMRYGEWFVTNSAPAVGSCASNTGLTVTSMHVCSEALPTSAVDVASLSWQSTAYSYSSMPNLHVSTAGGLAVNGDFNYYAAPGVYIEKLGLTPDGQTTVYQVTAYGYGGSADAVSVVRSTVKVTATSSCLSCSP